MIDEKLTDYIVEQIAALVRIPSPAGDTEAAIRYLEGELDRLRLRHQRTRRGALLATLPGAEAGPHRALTGHVDTLAAMVKQVAADGTLRMTGIGSYALGTVEGEYCTVATGSGARLRGTILFDEPSAHVSRKVIDGKREFESMFIRLDAEVQDAAGTAALGVAVGDYVHFDPRLELTDTGFVKTRHLDDKAGVGCLLGTLKHISDSGARPRRTTHFYFSTSEEIGTGAAAGIPESTAELIAVDMGAVGKAQLSDEYSVCICAKDTAGPFDLALRRRLVELCRAQSIPCKVDIYPHYSSDAVFAVRGGLDAVIGLIGPGINASHNLERTHRKALSATVRLILAYLELGPSESAK